MLLGSRGMGMGGVWACVCGVEFDRMRKGGGGRGGEGGEVGVGGEGACTGGEQGICGK
jgi:hypothetical protein